MPNASHAAQKREKLSDKKLEIRQTRSSNNFWTSWLLFESSMTVQFMNFTVYMPSTRFSAFLWGLMGIAVFSAL